MRPSQVLLLTMLAAYGQEESESACRTTAEQARKLYEAGDYERGLPIALSALHEAEGAKCPAVDLLNALNQAGLFQLALGRYDEADRTYRQALRLMSSGASSRLLEGHILNNLAVLHTYRRQFVQAAELEERAVKSATELQGPAHAETIVRTLNLSAIYLQQGKDLEAEALVRRVLPHFAAGSSQSSAFAGRAFMMLAVITYRRGDLDGSMGHMLKSVELMERSLGPEHPELLRPLENLGSMQMKMRQYGAAEETLRRALNLPLPPDHPKRAALLYSYAQALNKNGKKKKAGGEKPKPEN